MLNFQRSIREFISKNFDAQPQGDQQHKPVDAVKPAKEPTELELLQDQLKEARLKFNNIVDECEKEINSQIKAEKKKYPIAQLSLYSGQVAKQYFAEQDQWWKAIDEEYRSESNKANAEAKKYREQYKSMEWGEERKKIHKLHDEACDRGIAVLNLIEKLRDEADATCKNNYPYEMLDLATKTLTERLADAIEDIKVDVTNEYAEDIKQAKIEIEILEVQIDRIKNPEPEEDSPFDVGQEAHDFTEGLSYDND